MEKNRIFIEVIECIEEGKLVPSRMGAAVAAAARALFVAYEEFLIWEMIMEGGNRKNREKEEILTQKSRKEECRILA